MAENIDTSGFDLGAYALIGYSLFSWFFELFSAHDVNDFLQILLGAGGLVFLFFKIKNSYLDAKIKKKELSKDETTENNS